MSSKQPKDYSDGRLIKLLREVDGFNQKEVAEKLDIDVARLKKIEGNQEPIDNDELIRRISGWSGAPNTLIRTPPDEIFIEFRKLLVDILEVIIEKQKAKARRRKRTTHNL